MVTRAEWFWHEPGLNKIRGKVVEEYKLLWEAWKETPLRAVLEFLFEAVVKCIQLRKTDPNVPRVSVVIHLDEPAGPGAKKYILGDGHARITEVNFSIATYAAGEFSILVLEWRAGRVFGRAAVDGVIIHLRGKRK